MRRVRRGSAAAFALCLAPLMALAGQRHEEPLVTGLRLDRLEAAEAGAFAWRASAVARRDLTQLRLESRGAGDRRDVDAAEVTILYGRAVTAFFDVVAGWRAELEAARRDWFAIGVEGLAPWHIEVEGTLHLGGGGQTGLRLEARQAWLLTDRLVLVPEVAVETGRGDGSRARRASRITRSGLDLDLRYEISRRLAPYIGVRWHRLHGDTGRDTGDDARDSSLVVGVHAWY